MSKTHESAPKPTPQELEMEATRRLNKAGFDEDGLPIRPPESVEAYHPITPIHTIDRQVADPQGTAFLTLAEPPQW
ncbi:MAG: hypothetical protein WCT27_02070 [Patescibacteria group bacterium]|jgi:hypothetical protein